MHENGHFYLLSHARDALWRLNEGCPGPGTDVGLFLRVVSVLLPGRVYGTRGRSRCAVAGLWSKRRRCWRLRRLRHERVLARRHVVVSASRLMRVATLPTRDRALETGVCLKRYELR
jgi:hypothetical protein